MGYKRQILSEYIRYLKKKNNLTPKKAMFYLLIGLLVINVIAFFKDFSKKIFSKNNIIPAMAFLIVLVLFFSTFSFYSEADTKNYLKIKQAATRYAVGLDGELFGSDLDKIISVTNATEVTILYENLTPKNAGNSEASTFIEGKNPYYIRVNRQANCVTVYTYDKEGIYNIPLKAMVCSVGKDYGTPTGFFSTADAHEWCYMVDGTWGQYATRINGAIMFHSVPYYTRDSGDLEWEQYNLLGSDASLGCVRLSVEDSKWIFENCARGTGVEIYDDEDPGPLGKPEAIRVSSKHKWDPTEKNEENPWNEYTPTISGVESKIINMCEPVDLLEGVKAFDSCGNDVTKNILIETDLDLEKIGSYPVKYTITDQLGRSATITATYVVLGNRMNNEVELADSK